MRLPVVPQISTKDGTSNRNARLTNCLKEVKKAGEKAVVRPGLVLDAQASGVGNGLVAFNNELVSVYGATLGIGVVEGAATSVYSITDMELRGVANLGADVWCLYGYNLGTFESEIYTGDSSGSMTLNSTGFEVDYPNQPQTASPMAVSSTTLIVAKDQTLQKSTIAGILSFSTIQTITGQYYSIKYLGGKFVAVSFDAGPQATIRWSSDDGGTWSTWDAPTGDVMIYDIAYDGVSWWLFYFDDNLVELGAYKTTDFVTFTPQSFSGMNSYSTGGGYSVAFGNGYFYTSCSEDAVDGVAYSSANGLAWTELPELIFHFGEGASGAVYATGATNFYSVSSGSVSVIESGLVIPYGCASNSTNSTQLVYELSDTYDVIGSGVGTTPTLTTITGDYYDFAQSPI